MTQRLVVTGSECTGKTSLARDLAAHLGTPWVPEASRAYAVERLGEGRALTEADVEPIARLTMAAEDEALVAAPGLIVLDTDLISTVVYARHYYGACPAWIETAARERRAAHYLLCAPDIPWLADGVRDRPSARAMMHALFQAALEEFEAAVTVVSGLGGVRTAAARAAARALTAGPAAR